MGIVEIENICDGIDINKIVNYLKKYSGKISSMYQWKSPNEKQIKSAFMMGLINEEEMKILSNTTSYFERNVLIKLIINTNLKNDKNLLEQATRWIVKEWGGIQTAQTDKITESIQEFIKLLESENNSEFQKIASMSKVVSFLKPEKYVIYDSRVVYSLNWIMFKSGASEQYFPIPQSRNTKLNGFDMNVLLRIKYRELYRVKNISEIDKNFISKRDAKLFISKEKAYSTFCNVIKSINESLWDDVTKYIEYPFYTEMLLFSMADKEILNDIINTSFNILE